MKSTSIVVGTVSSVLLVGVGVALYFAIPPVPDERFRSAIGAVQSMQRLGAEWSVETARVRADPGANFDGLAAFVPRMRQLKEDLTESLANIPDVPERLTADTRSFLAAVDGLRERVERFKTTYAVIRNSERYFPLASADLILQSEQAGNKRLAREIADIAIEMDTYLTSPDDSVKERLGERLRKLNEARGEEPEDVATSISNFVAHALVLLDKRERSQELFKGITSSTLSERTKPLTDILESEFDERRRAAALQRQALVGIGAGVLIIWIFVGFTRRSPATRRSATTGIVSPAEDVPDVASMSESLLAGEGQRFGSDTRDDDVAVVTEALQTMGAATGPAEPEDGFRTVSLFADMGAESGMDTKQARDEDTMVTLLTTGTVAGLMGQSMGAYARRVGEDLTALDHDAGASATDSEGEEAARRWRRVRADAGRLRFFAHRLVGLGRHLAPKDRESIDVNRCLDEVLDAAGAERTCAVERFLEAVPHVRASRTEIRLILALCIDHVLRSFQDMTSFEAKLEVRTATAAESVTISFIHNGEWLPPEERPNQFIPFYGSQDQTASLELPAARHLARKYGGTVHLDSLPDERSVLSVELSVDAERQ